VQRISISPDGRWVFTSDTEKPRLAVIDTRNNQVARWVDLPGSGYGSAFNKAGTLLLIAIPEKNVVAVVDIAKMQVAKTIEVPPAPQEIVISPNDDAFVSCDRSGKVAQISPNWNVKLIDAGRVADGLAWAR
jgi:DNA-binding beta-propeller fold protein YncE